MQGRYRLVIEGLGPIHDEKHAGDIGAVGREVVEGLVSLGHLVSYAMIVPLDLRAADAIDCRFKGGVRITAATPEVAVPAPVRASDPKSDVSAPKPSASKPKAKRAKRI